MALAGRTAANLDFLDEQYRDGEQALDALTDEIGQRLPRGALVYAPAAIGNHVDHALVKAAALQLRATGFVVSLYADLPHPNVHGWPAWVRSSRMAESKDPVRTVWEHALAGSGAMAPTIRELGPEARVRKLLDPYRAADRADRACERDHQVITQVLHLLTAVAGRDVAQQSEVHTP